jgi:hypothetical protein
MRTVMAWVVVGLLLVGGAGVAVADGSKPATRLSRDLAELVAPPVAASQSAETPDSYSRSRPVVSGGWVTIDAVAAADPSALEAELLALGARNTAIAGRLVSAEFPIAAIPLLEGVTPLRFAHRALSTMNVGQVTSQGDKVLRADVARSVYGVDGTGVLVGVLSDTYNCLGGAGTDIFFGDLPPTVTVLQDSFSSCTDEGRAMLQIVHDVAPGAPLAFATANGGQANLANNIRALRDAGAGVIVDDVI